MRLCGLGQHTAFLVVSSFTYEIKRRLNSCQGHLHLAVPWFLIKELYYPDSCSRVRIGIHWALEHVSKTDFQGSWDAHKVLSLGPLWAGAKVERNRATPLGEDSCVECILRDTSTLLASINRHFSACPTWKEKCSCNLDAFQAFVICKERG